MHHHTVRAGTELANATLPSFAPETPPEGDGEKTGYGPRPRSPETFTGKDFKAQFAARLLSFLGDFPPRISLFQHNPIACKPPLVSPLHIGPCAVLGRTLGLPRGQCGAAAPKSGGSTPISGVHIVRGPGNGDSSGDRARGGSERRWRSRLRLRVPGCPAATAGRHGNGGAPMGWRGR